MSNNTLPKMSLFSASPRQAGTGEAGAQLGAVGRVLGEPSDWLLEEQTVVTQQCHAE